MLLNFLRRKIGVLQRTARLNLLSRGAFVSLEITVTVVEHIDLAFDKHTCGKKTYGCSLFTDIEFIETFAIRRLQL